ncbi:MAG: hypothetical protein M3Y87_00580 [Myxococcota bacterium]|nr:hypothetical protein [Myxococcota bacterium]
MACDDRAAGEVDSGSAPVDSGTTPTDGSTAADSGPPGDSGPVDGGQDGGPPPPATCAASRIHIEQTCTPPLAPCGGDVVGSWCYAEVCIEKDELLEEALMQPGVPADCTADDIEVRGSDGTIEGTIVFTDTTVARTVTSSATGTFYLSPDCMIVNCRATEGALDSALGTSGSATCVAEAPGCLCDITFESMVDDLNTYTLDGTTIVTGSDRRFDYCVEGDGAAMRFQEDAASGGEPGIQTVQPSATP